MIDRDGTGRERGAALFIMTVTVVVAAGLSFALAAVSHARNRAVEGRRKMECALAVAEAGLARGLAEANKPANKVLDSWPATGGHLIKSSPDNEVRDAYDSSIVMGRFVVELRNGLDDGGIDNDNDGSTTNDEEKDYVVAECTGYYGDVSDQNLFRVKAKGQMLKETTEFNISSALCVDDATPDIDLSKSAAFKVNGHDHDIVTGGDLGSGTGLAGFTSLGDLGGTATTGDLGDLNDKITAGEVQGDPAKIVPNPSADVDMDAIVEWVSTHPDVFTTQDEVDGTPADSTDPIGVWGVTYHKGDQKITGNEKGAGIWVVDGNLEWGGTCVFQGILIVTGKLTLIGGGGSNLLMGAVITGEQTDENFQNNGTTDVRYCSTAVDRAMNAAATYGVVGWMQVALE
jgi:hypothetical protein